jgi:NTE family protein
LRLVAGALMFGFGAGRRPLALALQGGGAHGAYTWGVLDALLERTAHPVSAISGTSAGAVNAVVLAHGLLQGGRDGAREALALFWQALGSSVSWGASGLVAASGDRLTPAGRLMMQWATMWSPSQLNPLGVDPLADLLARHVDFERLRQQHEIALFVAATHANSGRLRLFRRDELSADVVRASACLPTLQAAVSIGGEPYWDGGYSANPALFPLIHETTARELLIVMLSPWTLGAQPERPSEIRARAVEIAFNAAFLREMQALALYSTLSRQGWWHGPLERRLSALHWHVIDGHDDLSNLPDESRLLAHPQLLQRLHESGRARVRARLDDPGAVVGRTSSADLQRLFGDHLPPATSAS